jgi:hypothetical protein
VKKSLPGGKTIKLNAIVPYSGSFWPVSSGRLCFPGIRGKMSVGIGSFRRFCIVHSSQDHANR